MQDPAKDATEVFDWIMSRHVHEYFDTAGRPVGEGRAAAFAQVRTQMQLCPYAGGRFHHARPMNLSALRQMPPWQHLLTVLSWLSQRYSIRHERSISTCDDLAQVTGTGIFLADFLVLRRHGGLRSHEVPVLISGLYKLCLGFQLAYLPQRYSSGIPPPSLPDPSTFYAYLEENELLIGEAEVCAGSPTMITQAYEAIMAGRAVNAEHLPPPCAGLAISWEQIDVFAENASSIWHELVQFMIRLPGLLPELSDPRLPPALRDRLNNCLRQQGAELLAAQTGLVVDIARAAQLDAYRPATRPAPQPALPPDDATSSLARRVLDWLGDAVGEDLKAFAPVVLSELGVRLARYEIDEAAVLTELNRKLKAITLSLGFDEAGYPLMPSALSRISGRTLRDWGTVSA